ncbi:MAG: ribonuclease III [Parcubacteria group bacterium CG10_big_fil_rev_8_21_14_0_10_36_14]|nr:MAG: ribonuclease III [Parcubacteria group bacterium CG10_big_fil_rev_8_21_14_0_10_36_14]
MKDVTALAKKLGVKFKNIDFLTTAVAHRSYLNEHPKFRLGHNERLEFLGDAVIELVVTEYLFENYPNPEGDLTNWRASLVNANTLGELCRDLGVEDYMLLSRGEMKDKDSKARLYILANAFESIVGAIYLDGGYKAADVFLKKYLLIKLSEILEKKLYLDPKSRFQEVAQEKFGVTPNYKVLKEVGPDHAKKFTIGVYIGDEKIAEGKGTSKHEAQVDSARAGLEAKGWE